MTRPYDHWKSEFHIPTRKTPIGIHVFSHSWYRARHAAEVVATRIQAKYPKHFGVACEVKRAGPAESGRAARGDYVAVADDAGGIRVFRMKVRERYDSALYPIAKGGNWGLEEL